MDSAGNMTCELKVDTQSPGWHNTLMKILKSIQGVTFTIDAEKGIARVSGSIEPDKLMGMLAKAGKHAELLWVDSGNHYTKTPIGQDDLHRHMPMVYGNGYGYYADPGYGAYGRMDHHIEGSQPRYLHPEPSQYHPHYPYFDPPARYFPQAPPPVRNPRLESGCNLM